MKFQNILGAGLLVGGSANVAQASQEAAKDAIESVAERTKATVLEQVDNQAAKLRECGTEPSCTREKLVFRREYGSLSKAERLEYVDAVKCLQQLPPRTPSTAAAGAKSRFDDFVVTHINQTLTIHFTGNFMPWHRWFVHEYEKALREECGYTGYQPYWDWPRYASAPQDSPIFDGSPTSLGGNGEYVVHDGPVISPPEGFGGGDIQLPAGVGGGYVTTGPFANMTVNLGPVGGLNGTEPGPDGGLGYNPRRLKRDVGPAMNTRYANYTTVMNLLAKPDFNQYRLLSEGVPYTVEIGPHGGIHYTISGDPGADLFTSPGDPTFWTHHSMMDRMWSYWQLLDPETRFTESSMNNGTYGHITWANQPESRKTYFNDTIDMGYAGDSISIGEVMSTTSGPFCYFYL
ncbi:Di-copper centre-containing protein [Hortaea werneckii]|nr:Di-copper centre-containing protein [Hortaea werneckii]KAI6880229.1 Di-copper centre-containing protein [Hortaea werneckii]KAI6988459.1 Di-copper centre-containing protein [Hortaea werneckii]KAI7142256.1 Di-copper centre-containing protein [Hortaea werneckii]KAI7169538.1 Di-copper centre-containing protein [Hortaea werneckii]